MTPIKITLIPFLGFGSLAYPDFCQYAIDVDKMLQSRPTSKAILEVHTVNNQSFESYTTWVNAWSAAMGFTLNIDQTRLKIKKPTTNKYRVVAKTSASDSPDDTYFITLVCQRKERTRSGDLIGVFPPEESRARLYSIAWINHQILLSVKRHSRGVCSNYMNDLQVGALLTGYRVRNREFYFPKKEKPVVCVATGTGIAPFLGMFAENKQRKTPFYLYWGARNEESFELYRPIVETALEEGTLTQYLPAYSRQTDVKVYVQDLLKRDAPMLAITLAKGGTVMICGAIAMQKAVFHILQDATMQYNKKPMSYYQKKGLIKVDCY